MYDALFCLLKDDIVICYWQNNPSTTLLLWIESKLCKITLSYVVYNNPSTTLLLWVKSKLCIVRAVQSRIVGRSFLTPPTHR